MCTKYTTIFISILWIIHQIGADSYLIHDSKTTNYLETHFKDKLNHIFPVNLEISVYLTARMIGLLFYSIDRNSNQLIVLLQETRNPSISVEFRGESYYIYMSELCNCTKCVHVNLHFQFQITDQLQISCNNGRVIKQKYASFKNLNHKYPIPSFDTSEISAYLWLINTPKYNNQDSIVYPNNEYLTGCFSEVKYRNISLDFKQVGEIGNCVRQCLPGVCDDGDCIETFHNKPTCNCDKAFFNGEFCNSSISPYFGVHTGQMRFKSLKLSWNGIQKGIFKMNNKNIAIEISSSDKYIILKIKFNKFSTSVTTFFNSTKENNIIIMTFGSTSINVNSNQRSADYLIDCDLSSEYFNKIIFLDNSSKKSDIGYKESLLDSRWRPIILKAKVDEDLTSYHNLTAATILTQANYKFSVVMVILGILNIIGLIYLIFISIKLKHQKRQIRKTVTSHPLLSNENEINPERNEIK